MRIQSIAFNVGEQRPEVRNNSIFGGNLNRVTDPIAEKKQRAREQAMKIVSDAWEGEQKIDADMEERRQHVRELWDEIGACNKEIRSYEAEMDRLQESYGVAPDSKEQKDLELLVKEIDAMTPGKKVSLTKEEREELARIKEEGLTE